LLLLLSAINSDLISIDSILSRFITKNRESAGGFAENFSSGRMEIWRYYVNYIAENFTVWNYIFGTGSLELQGKYRINAHNDVLNIVVNFGFLGFILLVFIYYEIYKRLHPKYRKYVAFYFSFVFIANGIMFHQSNLLFLLYLQGNKDTY
jgi:O-antigen ligase